MPELGNGPLGLNRGLSQDEANWEVLVVVLHQVLKLILLWAQVEQQGLHNHVRLLCTSPLPNLQGLVVVVLGGEVHGLLAPSLSDLVGRGSFPNCGKRCCKLCGDRNLARPCVYSCDSCDLCAT